MRRLAAAYIFAVCSLAASTWAQTADDIREAQSALVATGRDPGPVDGLWGSRTQAALEDFMAEKGMSFDGVLSRNELDLLRQVSEAPVSTDPQPFDYERRMAFLGQHPGYANRACQLASRPEIPVVDAISMVGTGPDTHTGCSGGRCERDKAMLGEVYQAGIRNAAACFRGYEKACSSIVATLRTYAATGGLAYEGDPDLDSGQFLDASGEVAVSLKPLVGGYYLARQQGSVSEADTAVIDPWLRDTVRLYGSVPRVEQNNIATQKANLSVLTGLAINDDALIDRALRQYRTAIAGMRPDGSLPNETQRGSSAVHYTGLEISHLLNLAEFLAMAGNDVFDYEDTGKSIHLAMSYWLDVLENWDPIFPYAQANVAASTTTFRQQVILSPDLILGAFEMYRQRYPDHPNVERINSLVLDPRTCSTPQHREGRKPLYGLCSTPQARVALTDLIDAATGRPDRGMVPNFCMFGENLPAGPTFGARHVTADVGYSEERFIRYQLRLADNSLGDTPVPDLDLQVFADFEDADNDPASIEFARIFFPPGALSEDSSRTADYSDCPDILQREIGGTPMIGLVMIGDLRENECIFQTMAEEDRARLKALHLGFADNLATAVGDGGPGLRAIFLVPEPAELPRGPEFTSQEVFAEEGYAEENFIRYELGLSGNTIDGEPVRDLDFQVFADFGDAGNDPESLDFLRIFFTRGSLAEDESRGADYSDCRDILVRDNRGDQLIGLALVGDRSENNCILGKMAVPDRALFRSLQQAVPDLLATAAGDGGPGLRAAFNVPEPAEPPRIEQPRFSVDRATAYLGAGGENWAEHRLRLSGISLTGVDAPGDLSVPLLADYDSPEKRAADMNFLRIWFFRYGLSDAESREADYLACPQIVVRERNGDQQLALALLGDFRGNDCILDRMGPNDREFYTAVVRDLPEILATAATGDGVEHLSEALSRR